MELEIKEFIELNEVENDHFKILIDKGTLAVVAKFSTPRIVCNWGVRDKKLLEELKYFDFNIKKLKKVIVVCDIKTKEVLSTDALCALYDWDAANELLTKFKNKDGYLFKEFYF